jgi:hypothetical protein
LRPSLRLRVLALALLSCAALLFSSTRARAADADGWEQTDSRDGVTVFKRIDPNSPFRGIKGTGLVDAKVSTVAQVLLDDARAPEWVDSLDEARVVNVISSSEYIEYNHVHMPWPTSDREFLTRVSLSYDAAARRSEIRSAPVDLPGLPPKKGDIRGMLRASYTMVPVDGADGRQQTQLTVEIHSDPGGWIPSFLVNFFQKDWALETIGGIRAQAKKPDLSAPEEFKEWLSQLDAAMAKHVAQQ